MVEVEMNGEIDASIVVAAPVEEVEQMLHEEIGTKLSDQLMKHIDDMAFIDMSLNEETGKFEYKAELVLCSKNDIVTNIQIQAQLMSDFGLTQEQIKEVLETAVQETEGF